MKCPHCNADSRVLATREGANFTMTRRRECEGCKARFTTIEIHQPVFCSAKQRAKVHAKTIEQRVELLERDMEIARRSHEGWQKLADEFKLERSTVFLAAQRGRKHIKERKS